MSDGRTRNYSTPGTLLVLCRARSGNFVADHPALPLGQPPKEQTTCLMLLGHPAVLLSSGGRDG